MADLEREEELLEAEYDLLLQKAGDVQLKMAVVEGLRTGSLGGKDPDFFRLSPALRRFWIKKVRTHPHPFTFCVRHLRKRVANPERLCAWLKDQALGTTKWRKGRRKKSLRDSETWTPSVEELREAFIAYALAEDELDDELQSVAKETGIDLEAELERAANTASTAERITEQNMGEDSSDGGTEDPEAGEQGSEGSGDEEDQGGD